jgi:hypothetical protein
MQVFDSAVALGNLLNAPVSVHWVAERTLNCRFDRLWKIPDPSKISIHEHRSRPLAFWRTHPVIRRLPLRWIPGPQTFSADQNALLKSLDITQLSSGKDILIESYSRFRERAHLYSELTPLPELADRIQKIQSLFGDTTIGVHIRRTDNRRSLVYSPDDAFISAMRHEINEKPSVMFYLATDDIRVKRTFTGIFGDRILTTQVQMSRNDEQGIRDALVELYVLSRTQKILGSYWSSYSKVAAELGGIPLTRVIKQDMLH